MSIGSFGDQLVQRVAHKPRRVRLLVANPSVDRFVGTGYGTRMATKIEPFLRERLVVLEQACPGSIS